MKPEDYTLLIVEDNHAMRRLMESMVTGLGYTSIVTAKDGAEAWDIIEENNIDVILCDMIMPVMNGLQLLNKVRSSKQFYNLPFIMITGADNQSEIMYTLQAEVDHYILKPPNIEKLDNLLKLVIEQKAAPTKYDKAVTAGKFFFLNKNFKKALQCFKVASQVQSEYPMPYYYMGKIHKMSNNDELAIINFNKCIGMSGLYINALLALAEIYGKREEDKQLISILLKVVQLLPENVDIRRNLGAAFVRNNAHDKANEQFREAVKLAKGNKETLLALVEDFISAGLFDEADDLYLRKYKEEDTEKIVSFWNRLGDCCKKKKGLQKAKYFYMSALKYLPQDMTTNLNLASLLIDEKEYDGARAYINKVSRLYPDCREIKLLNEKLNKQA